MNSKKWLIRRVRGFDSRSYWLCTLVNGKYRWISDQRSFRNWDSAKNFVWDYIKYEGRL